MKLSYQEVSSVLAGLRISVLAGLRMLQDRVEDGTLKKGRKLPHFDDVEPLSSEQIDELCERLNAVR